MSSLNKAEELFRFALRFLEEAELSGKL